MLNISFQYQQSTERIPSNCFLRMYRIFVSVCTATAERSVYLILCLLLPRFVGFHIETVDVAALLADDGKRHDIETTLQQHLRWSESK